VILNDDGLIELIAQKLYCDSYTQYGTCDPAHWRRVSDTQRQFCLGQARAALEVVESFLATSLNGRNNLDK
jgi:hypothetical protein